MARTRRSGMETLDEKIEKTEQAISRTREQYDRLTAELDKLLEKKKAIQTEELMKAIANSPHSYTEILQFIQGGTEDE